MAIEGSGLTSPIKITRDANARAVEEIAAAQAKGVCVVCGEKVETKVTYCQTCIDKHMGRSR